MKKLRLLGLLAAGALLTLQSCKKNDPNTATQLPDGDGLSIKKRSAWNPGDVIINGKYRVVQYENPSKAVCVVGNSLSDAAKIHHWNYSSQGTGQQWNIVNRQTVSGTIYYSLENVLSGKAIEVPAGAVAGTQLEQRTYSGADRQLWSIKHVIYTVYLIVNKATGMALTLDQANPTADGAKITQTAQTWPGSAPQHFFFTNLDEFFVNPLLTGGPDPWVYKRNGFYYYLNTTGANITIRKTAKMSELRTAPATVVYTPPGGTMYSQNLWAPELHFLDNKWYVYFAADNGSDINHRMHVIENANADPTTGSWTYKGKIADASNIWAIDGTVLETGGNRYFIWSGWSVQNISQLGIQQLYIAQMSNPWTISSARVKIAEPYYSWEQNGLVNEGPQIVKDPTTGATYIIYSGSGCWTDDYKLGLIKLVGANPLLAANWIKKNVPVFQKSVANSVYGPGHCSFFKSGTEDWIIYHANPASGQGCGNARTPRMQKFTWNGINEPNFGEPASLNTALRQPSGE